VGPITAASPLPTSSSLVNTCASRNGWSATLPSKNKSITADISNNEAKQCKASHCYQPRYRVGGFCRSHTTKRHHYGGPNGRAIRLKEYEVERIETEKFIDEHIDHPAIAAATKWLGSWLEASHRGDTSLPAHRDMARLHRCGVTALSILKACASLWIYAQHRPALFAEDLQITYAMSRAVINLTPRETRPVAKVHASGGILAHHRYRTARVGAGTLQDIGGRLRRSLVALFININEGLNHQEQQQRKGADALRVPFITTVAPTRQL
jgi:hypothetical protein